MSQQRKGLRRLMSGRRAAIAVLGILTLVLIVAAACGDDDTPTPVPSTSTPVPATSTPLPPGVTPPPATSTPVPPPPTPTEEVMEDKDPIKIGSIHDLTGPAQDYGTVFFRSIDLAAEEINAAGGIDGHLIDLIVEDGKCNASGRLNCLHQAGRGRQG